MTLRSIAACVAASAIFSLFAAAPKASCPVANAHSKVVKEYLDFLYGTMTLADSLDYPRDFYAANIESALKANLCQNANFATLCCLCV